MRNVLVNKELNLEIHDVDGEEIYAKDTKRNASGSIIRNTKLWSKDQLDWLNSDRVTAWLKRRKF